MKKIYFIMLSIFCIGNIYSQANQNLSNLISPTSVNVALLPKKDSTFNLGNTNKSWKTIYLKGSIYLGGTRFLANVTGSGSGNTAVGSSTLNANTIGAYNTALGYNSLYSNTSGSYNTASGYEALWGNTTGNSNTSTGYKTLYNNTTGLGNSAFGELALYANTTGSENSAFGHQALNANTTGYSNSAFGELALYANTTGQNNSSFGSLSLSENTTGSDNSAFGFEALKGNTTGSDNIAIGYGALIFNNGSNNTVIGYDAVGYEDGNSELVAIGDSALHKCNGGANNTAVGTRSLWQTTTGSSNTVVGISAGSSLTIQNNNTIVGAFTGNEFGTSNATLIGYDADPTGTFSNITALGYQAKNTASNQVRIGNSSVTSIGGYASWSKISDGRYKKNIKEDIQGLAFINKIKPISYTLDITGINKTLSGNKEESSTEDKQAISENEKIRYNGFIAQDVEKAAKDLNYDFSGVDKPKNDNDLYGLRYSDFVVPLVKAVQELSKANDDLKKQNDDQQKQIDELKTMVANLSQQKSFSSAQMASDATENNMKVTNATLDQNIPNPFNQTTIIKYHIPQNSGNAFIKITDMNGRIIKTASLNAKDNGQIILQAGALTAGTYQYSLFVNEKLVDTKKMIILK